MLDTSKDFFAEIGELYFFIGRFFREFLKPTFESKRAVATMLKIGLPLFDIDL